MSFRRNGDLRIDNGKGQEEAAGQKAASEECRFPRESRGSSQCKSGRATMVIWMEYFISKGIKACERKHGEIPVSK